VSMARLKLQTALARAERHGGTESPYASEEMHAIDAASEGVLQAEAQLQAFPARPVLPFELPELLADALERCERILMISSRDLDQSVVDGQFVRRVEAALKRGVRVQIALAELGGAKNLAVELERLRGRHQNLELSTGKRGNFHYLVCDDRFAVVSNKPFLSSQAKVRKFHHIVGYLLQAPELVRAFSARVEPKRGIQDGRQLRRVRREGRG
jgi:hypothetical protein